MPFDVLGALPEDSYLGTHLLRAFALRRVNRVDEAVEILAQVAEAVPDRRYESLLAAWLAALVAQGRRLSEAASRSVARLLARAGERTVGLNRLLPGERALLAGFGELASVFRHCASSSGARSVAAGMLRRVGATDEALSIEVAAAGEEREPDLIQRGLTLRAAGRAAEAADVFAQLRVLDPSSASFTVEEARCRFVEGRFERAAEILAPVVDAADPELTGLLELCRSRPEGDRIELLDGLRRKQLAPPMEMPPDATANMFREHAARFAPGKAGMKVAISGWESPSNRLLVALHASGTTDVASASYTFERASALRFDPACATRCRWRVRHPSIAVRGGGRPSRSFVRAALLAAAAGAEHSPRGARRDAREASRVAPQVHQRSSGKGDGRPVGAPTARGQHALGR